MARYMAFVESLDHKVTMLVGNMPTKHKARQYAVDYIRIYPGIWQEHDRLRVVRQLEDIDVTLVVMGA